MLVKPKVRGRIKRRGKKHGNKIIDTEWGIFHSESELKRWQVLLTWEAEGRIMLLERGYAISLMQPGYVDMYGKRWGMWTYTFDYMYVVPALDYIDVIEDFKGVLPGEWDIKERRIRLIYPDMHFFVNDSIGGWYEPPADA